MHYLSDDAMELLREKCVGTGIRENHHIFSGNNSYENRYNTSGAEVYFNQNYEKNSPVISSNKGNKKRTGDNKNDSKDNSTNVNINNNSSSDGRANENSSSHHDKDKGNGDDVNYFEESFGISGGNNTSNKHSGNSSTCYLFFFTDLD